MFMEKNKTMITYDKQDDTYANIIINGEQVGWIERHKLHGCYCLNILYEKHWLPFKDKSKVNDLIMTIYKSKRYQVYSEVIMENKGFKILG